MLQLDLSQNKLLQKLINIILYIQYYMNELSNFDLLEILDKKNLSINGIYSKDRLPTLKKGFYIINIQNSDEGSGTHWTCLYYDNNQTIYFDSFGFAAPMEVQQHLKNYSYNDKQVQNIDSTACGYYCIAFILYLNNKNNKMESFNNFLNIFKTNKLHNDIILKNLTKIKEIKT